MYIGFRLREGRDDDIIEWISSLDKDRSHHIREAIRGGLNTKMTSPPVKSVPKKPVVELPEEDDTDEGDLEANLDSWL